MPRWRRLFRLAGVVVAHTSSLAFPWDYALPMDDLDKALCRASQIYFEGLSDALDAELALILPALVEAGYVQESDWGTDESGSGWSLWAFTDAGRKRRDELGCD